MFFLWLCACTGHPISICMGFYFQYNYGYPHMITCSYYITLVGIVVILAIVQHKLIPYSTITIQLEDLYCCLVSYIMHASGSGP